MAVGQWGSGAEGEDPSRRSCLHVETRFRRLVAYRLAVDFADELHQAVAAWSAFDRWSFGLQLVRAVDSVGANIAEASGRWTAADRRRLLLIARGSLYEAEHWLLRAEARGLLPAGSTQRLDEPARALSGLIKRPTPD
jgi:four helix bundle protein